MKPENSLESDYDIYYDPKDPYNTMVMLKKLEHINHVEYNSFIEFRNFVFLANYEEVNLRKKILHAMIKQ